MRVRWDERTLVVWDQVRRLASAGSLPACTELLRTLSLFPRSGPPPTLPFLTLTRPSAGISSGSCLSERSLEVSTAGTRCAQKIDLLPTLSPFIDNSDGSWRPFLHCVLLLSTVVCPEEERGDRWAEEAHGCVLLSVPSVSSDVVTVAF
jgi:hypothetical protein